MGIHQRCLLAGLLLVTGCTKPVVIPDAVSVFKDPTPTIKWAAQQGHSYHLVCKTTPKGKEEAVVVVNRAIQSVGQWTFDAPLDFERQYRCEVRDNNADNALVKSLVLVVQFEPAELLSPGDNQIVRNLRPKLRWRKAEYADVRYQLVVGDNAQLTGAREILLGEEAIQRYPGEDNQKNTADDVVYVEWIPGRDLETGKAFYWAVRTLYFSEGDATKGKRPSPEQRIGMITSPVQSFMVPAQTQMSESLAGVTRVTDRRPNADPREPTVSSNFSVAYTLVEATADVVDPFYIRKDKGTTSIHVINGRLRGSSPVFDRGVEQFTQAVEGSLDTNPAWDPSGDGIYFSSNRAAVPGIWHKTRSGRGYELVSNHDRAARLPSVSRDGKTIVYLLARRTPRDMDLMPEKLIEAQKNELFSIWKMDSDGRSPTDLGPGYDPAISNDGSKVAFVRKDALGCDQIVVMDLEMGGGATFLTSEGRNYHPRWAPDDKRIVFVSERDQSGRHCLDQVMKSNPNPDIWMIESDGSRTTRITDFIGDDLDPTFTPDGNHVIFASTRDSTVDRDENGQLVRSQFSLWMGRLQSTARSDSRSTGDRGASASAEPARPAAAPAKPGTVNLVIPESVLNAAAAAIGSAAANKEQVPAQGATGSQDGATGTTPR